VQELHAAYQDARAHKESSKALYLRAQAVYDNVSGTKKTLGPSPCLDALVRKVEEATVFVRRFNKRGWIGRMANRKDDAKTFAELNIAMTQLGNDLACLIGVAGLQKQVRCAPLS
jgi:hypothetical protein